MILPKPQLMKFDSNKITDHNRSALSMEPERIGNSQRMANGTMRKYYVADKYKFSCSWEMLPATDPRTVDKFWGANSIKNHYLTTTGPFTLTLTWADNTTSVYTVMWDSFSADPQKRGADTFYNVQMNLVEV